MPKSFVSSFFQASHKGSSCHATFGKKFQNSIKYAENWITLKSCLVAKKNIEQNKIWELNLLYTNQGGWGGGGGCNQIRTAMTTW